MSNSKEFFSGAVVVFCPCGNQFDMPRDALFALPDITCGQCGKTGTLTTRQHCTPVEIEKTGDNE